MAFPFFDAPAEEPSRRVGFTGNTLDRQSEHRADDCVEKALDDPSARLFVSRAGRLYMVPDGDRLNGLHDVAGAQALGAKLDQAILLGYQDGQPMLAAPSSRDAETLPETIKAIDYRSLYMQQLLPREMEAALAQGAALLAWHGTHRFCGRCGEKTAIGGGGVKRVCTGCKAETFPRTDPVAIMLAVDGERCVLGRSPHFPPGMYSCLAGFIEAGESIEEAVRRETLEESGIAIGRVAYHASQPWPFPHSLMIGCYGEAVSFDIDPDRTELEDCRWFTRDEVRVMLTRPAGNPDLPAIPPSRAIAHRLIADWVAAG
ncbi:NAD(+) diphosphatase [Zhengella mangrovi]|uniref:NAD(+) diphosphatase n=1 Tax=Zhengella mangrovi TaxID=1982044 RepID=A0A2G1QU60_9HYPH|nr:NAD(+) diphosphatase [Zhengella mangrovi]PHP69096.1 NAD(+) diphosphatase [Zhengella mangrovi]